MWEIINISSSFFSEDWNIKEYFAMLKGRFLYFRGIFLREYGTAGDWFFWGFIFFLAVILIIYIKSLADVLKRAENALEPTKQENGQEEAEEYQGQKPEEYEEQEAIEYDEYAKIPDFEQQDNELPKINEQEQVEIVEEVAKKEELEVELITEQEQFVINEEEEMDKKISADIVKVSKISDDYLNLKEVLYKQSKDNNEKRNNPEKEDNPEEAQNKSDNTIWDLSQLVGVIINMFAHKVSDKKIAQTAYFLNKGADDSEEIIQLIKALKAFIGYCNTGKFEQLPNRGNLPSCEDVLRALAEKNNKPCMELMESLLNAQVILAQKQKGLSKELSYALAAEYACTMGTIANLDNYELAINSFELALDLAPKSVNALSRTADLYLQDNNAAKAVQLYQQVLMLADDVIYPEQKANANLKLAQYYRNLGKMFKADELEKEGRKFYDEYGMKNPLSEAEINTLDVLLKEQKDKFPDYVKQLL